MRMGEGDEDEDGGGGRGMRMGEGKVGIGNMLTGEGNLGTNIRTWKENIIWKEERFMREGKEFMQKWQ
jgi:hypothetical protein